MGLTVVADGNIPGLETCLGTLAEIRRVEGRGLGREQVAGADALLVRSVTRVDRDLLEGSDVAFVGTATSGFDHVDRDYLQEAGIGFAHAPGSNANSVVEYVLAAIASAGDTLERLFSGARVGIVGYGHIGKALAGRLSALGIDYRVSDPWLAPEAVSRPADLVGVLECEVVTLHAELTRALPWPSFHLLGEEELSALSRDTLLINASRGPVLDNAALLRQLTRGEGPVTVLDVWEGEPAIMPDLLRSVAVGTPHIAGYSLDGKLLATRMLADSLASRFDLALPDAQGEAGLPPLKLEKPASGASLVRELLRARYRIEIDDKRLRSATLGAAPDEAALGFDRLRREYPERRELYGSALHNELRSEADRQLAQALGCCLETASGRR